MRESIKRWWEVLKTLPEATTLHGFKFIADSKRHWSERLFWLVFVAASWYGSCLLIAAQYDAYQNNPISFVVETAYKEWDTHFPSVAVCESDNTGRIENVSDSLFWLVFVAASWYGSCLLIAAQYDAYQNNPISFVVETAYKEWDTHFPSVAVCESDNTGRIENVSDSLFCLVFVAASWYGPCLLFAAPYDAYQNDPISFVVETAFVGVDHAFPLSGSLRERQHGNVSDSLWGVDHNFNLEEVLKELAYFRGITYYTSQFCSNEDPIPDCPKTNLSYFAKMVRSSCSETLSECSWNDHVFECCKFFRPMDTELGTCYAINSIQGWEANTPKLPMVSNKVTGPGSIRFRVAVPANVYILNEEDVPSLTTLGSDILAVIPENYSSDTGFVFGEIRRDITIRNIENDAAARQISPAKRKCRYTDENELDVYRHYSYSACTVQCRKEAQLRLCGCTTIFMPNVSEAQKCNVTGLVCLNDNKGELSVLKASWASRLGLYCDCLPSCTEAEISVVKEFKALVGESTATVQISLSVLPSERFRRNVVRGTLDLVVSMGGTGGLFLGASLLSFAELLYMVFFRSLCQRFADPSTDLSDSWHDKFGKRGLGDSHFQPNPNWRYGNTIPNKGLPVTRVTRRFVRRQ